MKSTCFRDRVQVINSSGSSYFVEKLLGKGSFGVVAQCWKTPTNETVALKIIRNLECTQEAKEEEAILKKMKRHNSDKFNIVRWNESFIYRGYYCLEFEKLDMNLLQFMKKSPSKFLSLRDIRPIVQQLATTLQFLESLGIAHADLKPANIMVEDDLWLTPRVKVIDFGLASEVSKLSRGTVVQTLWYRAPEILLGAPINEAIDVWSLGCTTAEMFMGQALFPGANTYDMMRHILYTRGKPPDHLLNSGMYTLMFFNPRVKRQGSIIWESKTPMEDHYYHCTLHTINCLNDLLLHTPACLTGRYDRVHFVDLLRKMLKMDPFERITPTQILQHPFITMKHLKDKYGSSKYSKLSLDCMHLSSDSFRELAQSMIEKQLKFKTSSKRTANRARRILDEKRAALKAREVEIFGGGLEWQRPTLKSH